MPHFAYNARDKDGGLHSGVMESTRKETVADQLTAQGLLPVRIAEERGPTATPDFFSTFRRVSAQDLIIFSRQLSTLVSAGISFIQSLVTLENQTQNPVLKAAISAVRIDVESGASFSEALAKHPRVFSKLYVSMVLAGETAGILDDILDRLAQLAEHDADTRERVKAAVRYPMIVVGAIFAAFFFLVSFVIPKFSGVFDRFKTELPLPTRVLIGLNYGLRHYWYVIVVALGLIVWGVSAYLKTPQGRRNWDGLKLRLPVFGMLFQKVALSRFARIFSAMQRSGIAIMLALEIAEDTVGNVVIARVVEQMRDSLREGKGLLRPMEASGLFPPLVMQMMAVGEETGKLDTMLTKVSDYYDTDVEYALRNLSTMIEPILLLFVGGMVLFLALGIFLPMWNMLSLFKM
jgi:type II secretory pathway component PulF